MGISVPEGLTAEFTKVQRDVESTLSKIEVAMKGSTESGGASDGALGRFGKAKAKTLEALAEASHAQQDFYSHGNWEDKDKDDEPGMMTS